MKILPLTVLVAIVLMSGCSSVQMLETSSNDSCNVRVFSSLESALTEGEIDERCVISGTSAMSFSHTVATAINKHKNKACKCGVSNVYVQSQDAGTLGTASVTLVGFNFVEKSP